MNAQKLSEVVDLQKGKKPEISLNSEGNLPYLTAKYIRGEADPEYGIPGSKGSLVVKPEDYLIIMDGSNSGEVFNGFNGILASTMGKLILKKEINMKYLGYFLDSNKNLFSQTKTGSAIPHLSKDVFFNLRIPTPPLQEQKEIAERLDKVFENIDNTLNNLKNKNDLSLALYISILQNTFLKFDSDHEPIENFCKELFAGGDRPEEFSKTPNSTFKYKIFSNGITNNGLYGFSTKYRVKEKALTISARGTIGHMEIREEPFTPIVRLITIVPNDNLNLDFLYHFLKYVLDLETGSVIPQLTVPMLKKIQIPKLSMNNQEKISKELNDVLLKSADLRMIINKQESLLGAFKKSILNREFSYE